MNSAGNRHLLDAGTLAMIEFLGVSNVTPVDKHEELMFHMPGCFRSENENSKELVSPTSSP